MQGFRHFVFTRRFAPDSLFRICRRMRPTVAGIAMTKWIRALAIVPLRVYKYCISPMLPPACRYLPTCSEYAMEAITKHGILRGGVYAVRRILRCHPWAAGGYDPVPPLPDHSSYRSR